jgi:CheY-like chemotaxis protein
MTQDAKILIIDDRADDAALTIAGLREIGIGHSIEHVTDGHTGIKKINDAANELSPYDIVILDIEMPIISGCETLEIIRNSDGIAGTYVAILTLLKCKANCQRNLFLCHKKKADIYLHKAMTIEDFEVELTELKKHYNERKLNA